MGTLSQLGQGLQVVTNHCVNNVLCILEEEMYRSEIQVTKLASWNHRMVKVGKDLYDPWVQPQPISTIPTDHVPKSER